jgi:hypothetical protein
MHGKRSDLVQHLHGRVARRLNALHGLEREEVAHAAIQALKKLQPQIVWHL